MLYNNLFENYLDGDADNLMDIADKKDIDVLFENENKIVDHGPIDRSFEYAIFFVAVLLLFVYF